MSEDKADIDDEGIMLGELKIHDPEADKAFAILKENNRRLGVAIPEVTPRVPARQEVRGHSYFQVLIEGSGSYLEKDAVKLDVYTNELADWADEIDAKIPRPEKWNFFLLNFDPSLIRTDVNIQLLEREISPKIIRPGLKPKLSFNTGNLPKEFDKVDHDIDYFATCMRVESKKVIPILLDGFLAFVIAPQK